MAESRMFTTEKCMLGCNKKATVRGLCSTCYAVASKLVNKGEYTWEKLELMNLAKKSTGRFGRFRAALEAAKISNEETVETSNDTN